MEGLTINHWATCPARHASHFEGRDPDELTEVHQLFALPGPLFRAVSKPINISVAAAEGASAALDKGESYTTEPAFQVLLDVTQFKPEDIMIQVFEGWLLIKGKHENRMDEHGFIARCFTRQFPLPEGLTAAGLRALLCHDGILVVEAKEQKA
ncbi:heat shock protein beta-3 [Engraulis encrasicolus]|uniref:heat shock protein beta-3 n=1 Tax=Engraulis encrasicolus TaxID=184585 RepID=UPI002FD635B3